MRRITNIAVTACALATLVALGACGGTPPKEEAPTETAPTTDTGADTSSLDREMAGADESATDIGPHEGVLAKRVIFFDFDSTEIRGEGPQIISAHARHLATRPGVRVRLEGHADERGSREYNIALAERRAQAVRRALMLQGAGDAQLTTVSYGEERPAAVGSDESAYEKNRRVELVYGR